MTAFTFTDLRARSENLQNAMQLVLDVASAAIDEIDCEWSDRRFVSPVEPPFEAETLCVYLARGYLGQAGHEQFQYPEAGSGVLGLHVAQMSVLLLADGFPTTSLARQALKASTMTDNASRLTKATWAVFLGLLQTYNTDQLKPQGFRQMLVGPITPAATTAQANLTGMVITVALQT